jgi:hypothetical protein
MGPKEVLVLFIPTGRPRGSSDSPPGSWRGCISVATLPWTEGRTASRWAWTSPSSCPTMDASGAPCLSGGKTITSEDTVNKVHPTNQSHEHSFIIIINRRQSQPKGFYCRCLNINRFPTSRSTRSVSCQLHPRLWKGSMQCSNSSETFTTYD